MSAVVDLKTKEEKDAELDRRIEALRKKNEALMKRHQEIEEDKKKAEQEGIAVTTHRKPRTHEPDSERRKIEKENITVTVLSKPSGVRPSVSMHQSNPSDHCESRVVNDRQSAPHRGDRETEEGFAGWPPHRTGSGRLSRGGQRGGGHRTERREPREEEVGGGGEGPSHNERSRGRRGGRGGRGSMEQGGSGTDRKSKEWEEKRRQNIEKMNEEMEKIAEYERGQRTEGEKYPTRNFLDDPRRSGPIPEMDRKEGSRRHVRNWGGLDFENVKTGTEGEKEWMNRRPGGRGSMDMTLSMTGRERAEYLRWKKERAQIDEERLARHRNATGQWRREWDAQKTDTMFTEDPAVGGEGMPEPSSRRADRGRNARTQQRRGASDDSRKKKAPTFGDFLGQGKLGEAGRGGRGRGKGQGHGKSYSMHDNRWETEKEEEKGKKEEQEKEKTKETDEPKAPLEKIAVVKEKSVAEDEDDEWVDASDVDEDEAVEESEDKEGSVKDCKPKEKSHSSPAPSSPSPKEQRTPRPKVHIPSSPQECLATPEGTKPLSPFSPPEGHQPVSDWGEEMEMLSPKSSLGESPLRPNSNESSPAQNKSREEEEEQSNDATDPPKQSDKQNDTLPVPESSAPAVQEESTSLHADSPSSSNKPTEPADDSTTQKEESAVPAVELDLKQSGSEGATPVESTDQTCSG
ncbi:coiled-coil domain-containing protein 9 isoform X4 [Ictalurus furcatus]|uniref:coiled-coil domain-containing protein 9 isoform X4 n=1 Tax=Ictalurus furcatus TaxID=66913 RepID=UPI002350B19A|nr:coiled-coil domain-containing protein 9 isoform X4 [Ictalurus furcatus]